MAVEQQKVDAIAADLERAVKALLAIPNDIQRVSVAQRVFGITGPDVLAAIEAAADRRKALRE